MARHANYTHAVTAEILSEDGERVILTHEVRIDFVAVPYVPMRMPDLHQPGEPPEGGYCEFNGARVLGNQGGWIELRHGDPLYTWAYSYFHDNEHEFADAAAEKVRQQFWEEGDREYDRMRDDRMTEKNYDADF